MTNRNNDLLTQMLGTVLGFEPEHFRSNNAFPPHNLIALPPADDGTARFVVEVAVAGYRREDLSVSVQQSVLSIEGTNAAQPAEDDGRRYIAHGIAKRAFRLNIGLSSGMQVDEVSLQDGMLTVLLKKTRPEVLKLDIKSPTPAA